MYQARDVEDSVPQQHPNLPSFAARAAIARSRFQEGSMNDRVSAAPPADFLGSAQGEEIIEVGRLAYTTTASSDTTFNASRDNDKSKMNRRSVQSNVSGGSSSSKKSSFFGPLLDGLKEKLGIGRSKSSHNFGKDSRSGSSSSSVGSNDGVHAPPPLPQQPFSSAHIISNSAPNTPTFPNFDAAAAATAGGARPTREEIMASYQNLMKSGFFDAHVIQSSRHAPPGSRPGTLPSQMSQARPSTSHGRHQSDQFQFPNRDREVEQQAYTQQPESPYRGTKRSRADGDEAGHGGSTAGHRLIKKLRKSTSRLADRKPFGGQPLSSPTEETFTGLGIMNQQPQQQQQQQQQQPGNDHDGALSGMKKLTKSLSRKNLTGSLRGRDKGLVSNEQTLPDIAAGWTGRQDHRHESDLPRQRDGEIMNDSQYRERRAERRQHQHQTPLSSPIRSPPQLPSPRNSFERSPSRDEYQHHHTLSSPTKLQRRMPLKTGGSGGARQAPGQSPYRSSMPPSTHANSTSSRHNMMLSSVTAPTVVPVPPPSFHYPQRRRPQPLSSEPLRVSPSGGRGNRRATAVAMGVKHYASMDVVMVDVGDCENKMRY
ncbi:hypothetical protein MCOR27_007457 [Pyricularia oryzae]|uniref:Uncharacterized protein n=1 Tax=Pyricularia grisea TaxID=148305 RepID=A0ABQ8N4Q1_PYRGI|nr:hypothetical protein MCOR01_005253 [Pyricularia oryzae]KAI6291154.1 hypothetical protein MCOR33_010808 [Pyricularia grisea]KAH9427629.1 hypothetical protein MCOR02_011865 [Pyricularia oryzae]KAI6255241.1 hypothetical protein MCOR19_008269 [Pyricularia oryzae]KAI6266800.1 hypothetical protein MCOR26_010015 [Pyricularia oryzae]